MSIHLRAWDAPAMTVLSVRKTANRVGRGSDSFLREDDCPGPALAAPPAQGWQAPAVSTLSVRSTANRIGPGPDVFLREDVYGRPAAAPAAPPEAGRARRAPGHRAATTAAAPASVWEPPAVTALGIGL